eukprot:Skav212519  [mRNA]  locus=scaffold1283:190576:192136:+ [translate_table: standard]
MLWRFFCRTSFHGLDHKIDGMEFSGACRTVHLMLRCFSRFRSHGITDVFCDALKPLHILLSVTTLAVVNLTQVQRRVLCLTLKKAGLGESLLIASAAPAAPGPLRS